MIYILCFNQQKHYLGYKGKTLSRSEKAFFAEMEKLGLTSEETRSWPYEKKLFERLKNYGYPKTFCPKCTLRAAHRGVFKQDLKKEQVYKEMRS